LFSLTNTSAAQCTVWGTRSLNSVKRVFSAQKKGIRAADNQCHRYVYDKDLNKI